MKVHHIPFQKTGYFSKLICDYLDENSSLSDFYGNFPNLEGFKNQLGLKADFSLEKRKILVEVLNEQYNSVKSSSLTASNIKLLENKKTFTITTGHQLNIFTGPLYFLYKITSVINLCKKLKNNFPQHNFVPVYWMASEDHDFEEINFFNFKETKISWNNEKGGAVGRITTEKMSEVFDEFSKLIGNSDEAVYLKELFKNAYLKNKNLAEATRYLVNELFGIYGLVIIDGDNVKLKQQFIPVINDELQHKTSYQNVIKTNNNLEKEYNIQVNPRELNLFYLKDSLRERIIFENNLYKINNTKMVFTKAEILAEVAKHPDRFSPNVIMRPLYQETILPNVCYIGGGGELAYWFQLKKYFNVVETPFPIVLLRNSVVFVSKKQKHKLEKLGVSLDDLFKKQQDLVDKKVKEISAIEIDFSSQKKHLQQQFTALKVLAKQTDVSFLGAVNAQEKKQLNGLDTLEKRLLKAQKRKLEDVVKRIIIVQNELFPKHSLEERTRNFSEMYLKLGTNLIPSLLENLDPLNMKFNAIEY